VWQFPSMASNVYNVQALSIADAKGMFPFAKWYFWEVGADSYEFASPALREQPCSGAWTSNGKRAHYQYA
jgi:hypothetical protein